MMGNHREIIGICLSSISMGASIKPCSPEAKSFDL